MPGPPCDGAHVADPQSSVVESNVTSRSYLAGNIPFFHSPSELKRTQVTVGE